MIETGRDPKNNWAPLKPWVLAKLGKIITFLTPYFLLPLLFNVLSMGGDQGGFIIPKLILAIGILGGGIYLLNKLIISQYIFDDKKLAKSPILAGCFLPRRFGVFWFCLYNILPTTFIHNFCQCYYGNFNCNFHLVIFQSHVYKPRFCSYPADNNVILSQVAQLIELGKFDTDHFVLIVLLENH